MKPEGCEEMCEVIGLGGGDEPHRIPPPTDGQRIVAALGR